MMKEKEVCGTCRYNRYDTDGYDPDGSGVREQGGFFCGNENSYNSGCPTMYTDSCDDWESKAED